MFIVYFSVVLLLASGVFAIVGGIAGAKQSPGMVLLLLLYIVFWPVAVIIQGVTRK